MQHFTLYAAMLLAVLFGHVVLYSFYTAIHTAGVLVSVSCIRSHLESVREGGGIFSLLVYSWKQKIRAFTVRAVILKQVGFKSTNLIY